MFKRVLSPEETRGVPLLDATAIEIDSSMVSSVFGRRNLAEVPSHLKRVKRNGNRYLFLVCIGTGAGNGIAVKVPEYPPCTPAQFQIAREAWPCHYSRAAEEAVDVRQALFFMDAVARMKDSDGSDPSNPVPGSSNCFCTGICIICDGSEMLIKCSDSEFVFGHAVLEAVSTVSRSQRGYLCTGYTAYLYAEPCVSCAMALVHGRIKRVFCFKKATGPGASYSGLKFNYNRFLNHRYNVYFYDAVDSRDGQPQQG